ncbi:hypothetical protein [Aurantiacibacter rhizosphaerae]|uniref:Lipoprotein n=1 Tax=Aurantiacibacter rhizosphaerae TaxID=2691582 RepID=A0A844XBG3_9SPHN|nr:hypothetical protein [Aurantiacibacter rhizosphaerae]MWV27180.1 hypothetical protein [Aurantiacibacter rhizosphaerae]
MKYSFCALAALAIAGCSQGENGADPAVPATQTTPSASASSEGQSASTSAAPTANADDKRADRAPLVDEIPARFHGTYAQGAEYCDDRSHGLFTIAAREIDFFESTGEVRNVRADGDYAAVTVFEQYGDGPGNTYAFYMRIMPDGSLRYRYDDNERLTWGRCSQN